MELFANNATTTLGAAITSTGATSITVSSSTGFPSTGNFRILIDSEILLVTAVSGTTWTVTRGQESTTAATHSNGAALEHVLTASALQNLVADRLTSGAYGSLPAAAVANRLYFGTDVPVVSLDTGSSWQAFGPLMPFTAPNFTGYSWVNQSTASITQTKDTYVMKAPAGNGSNSNLRLYVKNYPTAPFTFTVGIIPLLFSSNYTSMGIAIYDGTKTIGFGLLANQLSNSPAWIQMFNGKWSTVGGILGTGYNAVHGNANVQVANYGPMLFLRFNDDSVNRNWSFSFDGQNFLGIYTQGNTDFLTPTKLGLYVDSYSQYQAASMTILHLAG